MEDLVKFSHPLELSSDARRIMLDMIRSMQSLFPLNPMITVRENSVDCSAVMDQASEILRIVRMKQGIFDGIINTEDLEKYLKAASDFGEICDQVEKLQDALREYHDIAFYLTNSLASMIKEHLEMTYPEGIALLNKRLTGSSKPTSKICPKSRQRLRVV